MSVDMSSTVLNGLSDHYASIFGPKYAELYRQNIGKQSRLSILWLNSLVTKILDHSWPQACT